MIQAVDVPAVSYSVGGDGSRGPFDRGDGLFRCGSQTFTRSLQQGLVGSPSFEKVVQLLLAGKAEEFTVCGIREMALCDREGLRDVANAFNVDAKPRSAKCQKRQMPEAPDRRNAIR